MALDLSNQSQPDYSATIQEVAPILSFLRPEAIQRFLWQELTGAKEMIGENYARCLALLKQRYRLTTSGAVLTKLLQGADITLLNGVFPHGQTGIDMGETLRAIDPDTPHKQVRHLSALLAGCDNILAGLQCQHAPSHNKEHPHVFIINGLPQAPAEDLYPTETDQTREWVRQHLQQNQPIVLMQLARAYRARQRFNPLKVRSYLSAIAQELRRLSAQDDFILVAGPDHFTGPALSSAGFTPSQNPLVEELTQVTVYQSAA